MSDVYTLFFQQLRSEALSSGTTYSEPQDLASVRISRNASQENDQHHIASTIRSLTSAFLQGATNFEQFCANLDPRVYLLRRARMQRSAPTVRRTQVDSDPFEELMQMQYTGSTGEVSQYLLPMVHLAANNLLPELAACEIIDALLRSRYRMAFVALVSTKTPAARAIARTFFRGAIIATDPDLVKTLLATGIDPDGRLGRLCYMQDTPLHIAISAKSVSMIDLLLKIGVNVHCHAYMADAAGSGQVELLDVLLHAGADINAQSETKETALSTAVGFGDIKLVNHLISHGADASATATLDLAVRNGDLDIIDSVLAATAFDPLDVTDVALRQDPYLARYLLQYALNHCISLDGLFGVRALRAAVGTGDLQLAQSLLDSGVDVKAYDVHERHPWRAIRDFAKTTALHDAVRLGNTEMVQLMLDDRGADVNGDTDSGTALELAVLKHRGIGVVQTLLRAGAVILGSARVSPLEIAAANDDFEVMQLLLHSGQDLRGQITLALFFAIKRGSIELVRLCLKFGKMFNENDMFSQVNTSDLAALEIAVSRESEAEAVELARLLIDEGAEDMSQALRTAAYGGRIELMELLFCAGADVNAKFGYFDESKLVNVATALEAATRAGQIKAIQFLLDRGSTGTAGALQVAAHRCELKLMKLFIEAEADVNAVPQAHLGYGDPYMTALQAAAYGECKITAIRLLLGAGADVNGHTNFDKKDLGCQTSALAFAAIAGDLCAVQELITRGANVNADVVDDADRMPLEGAAEHGRLDVVQLLLNLHAEVRGTRALEFARREGHGGVVQLLLEHLDSMKDED